MRSGLFWDKLFWFSPVEISACNMHSTCVCVVSGAGLLQQGVQPAAGAARGQDSFHGCVWGPQKAHEDASVLSWLWALLYSGRIRVMQCFPKTLLYLGRISSMRFFFFRQSCITGSLSCYHLTGLVKATAFGADDPGFNSCLRHGDFSGSSHASDLKIGTPVATLPGAWRYRVSTGTGWPGVSILWLGEVESLISNFCLSVAVRTIVWAGLFLKYSSMLLGDIKQTTNNNILVLLGLGFAGFQDIFSSLFFFFCQFLSSGMFTCTFTRPFSISDHGHMVQGYLPPWWPNDKMGASIVAAPCSSAAFSMGFFQVCHISDLKTGTPVATLPGAWRYRVSAGTGRPGVSILWLG